MPRRARERRLGALARRADGRRGLAVPWLLLEILFLVAVAVLAAVAGLERRGHRGGDGRRMAPRRRSPSGSRRAGSATRARPRLRRRAPAPTALPEDPSWFAPPRRATRARDRRPRTTRRDAPAASPAGVEAGTATVARGALPDSRALPDRNLRDLLHGRAAALVAADAARRALAPVHRSPRASSSTPRGTGGSASCSRSRSSGTRSSRSASTAAATRDTGSGSSRARSSGTSGCSATSSTTTSSSPRRTTCSRSCGVDVPLDARSIVLPVGISFFTFMGDRLRRRRLPARLRAGRPRDVRRLPLVLPAPRRRADRPAGRADPAARRRRATRATSTPRAPSS